MSRPPSSPAPDEALPSVVSGRFALRRLIGEGGMAAVYEAADIVTGRVGALKLLKPLFREVPEAVQRLAREASVGLGLCDDNIVRTLDAGRLDTGEPYLFMELLEGAPLDAMLRQRGRLPVREALEIAAQAAAGLCAAHAAQVLHRDVKPANLFLVDGPSVRVKLLDFGVSKVADPKGALALTKEGRALGTFAYMPPEQMMGAKRVDARADLYALGVVLYQSLVGSPPFVAKSLPALSLLKSQNQYAPVSRSRPDAPPELDGVIERCLRADPEQRYESAEVLRGELVRLCRRSVPHRTVSVGTPSEAPGPPSPLAAPLDSQPEGEPRASRDMAAPDAERDVTASETRAVLIETIVPKTRGRPS